MNLSNTDKVLPKQVYAPHAPVEFPFVVQIDKERAFEHIRWCQLRLGDAISRRWFYARGFMFFPSRDLMVQFIWAARHPMPVSPEQDAHALLQKLASFYTEF